MYRIRFIRGFTLIELMITVTVAAIILTMALPSFAEFIRNNRRAAAVNEFMAAANLARAEALRRASRVTMCRTNDPTNTAPTCGAGSNGWEEGWITFHDANGDNTWDAGEDIIKVYQPLAGDILIDGIGTPANLLAFSASGALAPGVNNGTLRVCNKGDNGKRSRDIVVSSIGRLRTEKKTYPSCPP